MGNWRRLFGTIEVFKGRGDKVWRVTDKQRGPKRVPKPLSAVLDKMLRPKT